MSEQIIESKPLGSYEDFLQSRGIENSPEAINEYSTALSGLRESLMVEFDVTEDELHSMHF